MNEQLVLFENQEVKIRTENGTELFNLANSSRVCGLCRKDDGRITWKGNRSVYDKIAKIRETLVKSAGAANAAEQKYTEEIDYILNEIENTDDRNSIYMSRYLTSMLAMECHNEKATQYKSWLAKLDEKYSNGELQVSNQQVAQLISTTVQGIVPIMVTEITKQFAPMLGDSKKQVDTMVGLMHDQAIIYEEERNELKGLIGFHSVNTTRIVNTIKDKLSEELGYNVMANNPNFQKVKKAIFKEFKVFKWEDISVCNYSRIFAFTDEYISDFKVAN